MRTRTLIALLTAALAITAAAVYRQSSPPTAADSGTTTAAATTPAASGFSTAGPPPTLTADGRAALDGMLAALETAGGGPELEDAATAAFFAVLAELRRTPGYASEIEAMLADADRSDPKTRLLLGALVGANTPESEAAVVRLFATRASDSEFLKLLVPTAGFEPAPGPDLLRAVRQVASTGAPEIRHMADLALGNMADQLQRTDPAESRRIVADYAARLGGAGTAEEARAALAALGNAATPESLAVVKRHLADARPVVRAEAVEALRLDPGADAEASLVQALRADTDEDVRSRAAWALARRTLTGGALDAQIAALAVETSESVARALIESLLVAASTHREVVLGALTRTAASHPVAAIQEQAQSALTQIGAS